MGLMLSSGSHDLVAVHLGHFQIGHDRVKGVARERFDGVGSGRERHDVVPVGGEQLRDAVDGRGIVIHNQEFRHGFGPTQAGCPR